MASSRGFLNIQSLNELTYKNVPTVCMHVCMFDFRDARCGRSTALRINLKMCVNCLCLGNCLVLRSTVQPPDLSATHAMKIPTLSHLRSTPCKTKASESVEYYHRIRACETGGSSRGRRVSGNEASPRTNLALAQRIG
jgi:hypothetical protein